MDSTINWQLLARHLEAETTPAEEEQLQAWMKSDPENQKTVKLLQGIWINPEIQGDAPELVAAWKRLSEKTNLNIPFEEQPAQRVHISHQFDNQSERPRHHMLYAFLRYAAIFLLFLSIPILYVIREKSSTVIVQQEPEKLVVANGQLGSLKLPDGTTVMLDAGSEISFPKKFSSGAREVTISGEAFFEVVSDSQKSFVVHTGNSIVQVHGTKFNIQAWSAKKEVRVTVAEGSVSMKEKNQTDEAGVMIPKGKMSVLTQNSIKPTPPVSVDVDRQIGWMRRELIVEGVPLSEVLEILQRWYDLTIELPSPLYRSTRITVAYSIKPIDEILEELALMINLSVQREGNKVTFQKKR